MEVLDLILKVPYLFFRWEAEQIPKVKVAKVDKNKVNKEQTVYMPQIPDIMKCPDNLLPLKQWEDSFLADFSKLRLVTSCLPYYLLYTAFCLNICKHACTKIIVYYTVRTLLPSPDFWLHTDIPL